MNNIQGLSLMNMFENTIGGFFTNISKDLEALASDVGNAVEGIKMSGISTALVNGTAGGLAGGITTGDWKGSMVDSVRSSAANYLGGSMGGGNEVLTNASSMLFEKMLGSKADFSWDAVGKNDAIGKLVGNYLNEILMSDEQKEARIAEEQKRQDEQEKTAQGFKFMNLFENTIGGFFTNISKDLEALASDVGNAVEGVKGVASWVKDVAVSAWEGVAGAVGIAVGVVGDFVEKTGNWVTEGHFKTNEQVEEIRAQERIEEAVKNGTALQEGSAEYNRMLAALYGSPEVKAGAGGTGEMSHAEYMQKFKEMEERLNGLDNGVGICKLSQQGLDQMLNGKGGCKIASYLILAEKRMREQGLDVSGFDEKEIYEKSKQKGDVVIKDKFWVTNETELVKTAGVKGDISWGKETDPSQFSNTIIQQIDRGNPVMMILDDQHASVIYGYENKNDNLRFLVHDVGYQKDTYLNSNTWQPYKVVNSVERYSTQKGIPQPLGKERQVLKLLYLK